MLKLYSSSNIKIITLFLLFYSNLIFAQFVNITTGTQTVETLINGGNSDGKGQYIYTKNEILAAGGYQGLINKLSVHVSVPNSSSYPTIRPGFTIKMGHLSESSFSGTQVTNNSFFNESSFTTVYTNNESFHTTGLKVFNLTTPFNWNGNDNIIVQICFNDNTLFGFSGALRAYSIGTSARRVVSNYSSSYSSLVNGCSLTSGEIRAERIDVGFGFVKPCTDPSFVSNTATISSASGLIGDTFSVDVPLWNNFYGHTFQWQVSSSLSGPWSDIVGVTYLNSSLSTNAAGAYYLRCVATCTQNNSTTTSSVISYTALVECNNLSTNVATISSTSGYINSTYTLSANDWIYSSGAIGFQWQKSSNGSSGWENIAGATGLTHTITAGTALGQTYYRCEVTCPGTLFNQYKYSNVVSYNVVKYPCTHEYFTDSNSTISSSVGTGSGSVTLNVPNWSNVDGLTFKWQMKTSASGSWVDINGATSLSYVRSFTSISGTHYFRCIATCGSTLQTKTSSEVSYTVQYPCNISVPNNVASISSSSGHPYSTFTLSAPQWSAITGEDSFYWQVSTDQFIWNNLPNSNTLSLTLNSGNVIGTRYYRCVVVCNSFTSIRSNIVQYEVIKYPCSTFTVEPENVILSSYSGLTGSTITASIPSLNDYSGLTFYWQWKLSTSTSWTTLVNTLNNNIITTNPAQITFSGSIGQIFDLRMVATCGSTVVNSNIAQYKILGPCSGIPSGSLATLNSTSDFPNSILTLNVPDWQNYPGPFKWQSSPDQNIWTDIPGANTLNVNVVGGSVAGVRTYYRAVSTCGSTKYSNLVSFQPSNLPCTDLGFISNETATISSSAGPASGTIILDVPNWIKYNGLTFQWYKSNSPIALMTPITGATSRNQSINLNTLSPNSGTHYFHCIATCSITGIRTSRTVSYTIVSNNYCIPSNDSSDSVAALYIQEVGFNGLYGDFTKMSGKSSTGYEDFTSEGKVTQVRGEGINVNFTANRMARVKAWVDWNRDGVFNNTSEVVYDTGDTYLTSVTTFGFSIPENVPAGDYRIRIRNYYSTAGLVSSLVNIVFGVNYNFNACEAFNLDTLLGLGTSRFGEAEDYSFTVLEDCKAVISDISNGERCGAGTVSLSATSVIKQGATGSVFSTNWYDSQQGGNLLGTIDQGTFNPTISETTFFWVAAVVDGCESMIRHKVVAKVNKVPNVVSSLNNDTVCGYDSEPIQISAESEKEIVYLIDEDFEDNSSGFMLENISGGGVEKGNPIIRTSTYIPSYSDYPLTRPALASGFSGNKFISVIADYPRRVVRNFYYHTQNINTQNFDNLYLDYSLYYKHTMPNALNEYVRVLVSVNGGAYTEVKKYTATTGVPNNFANEMIDLSEYVGVENLRVSFEFKSFAQEYNGGDNWWPTVFAFDNFKVYGQKTLSVSYTWDNIEGLFKSDCVTPIGSGLINEGACFKPTESQLENDTEWVINSTAILENGCPSTSSVTIYNKSKVWNVSETDWDTELVWKPSEEFPTIENCVIVKDSLVIPNGVNAYAKNLVVTNTGSLVLKEGSNLIVDEYISNLSDSEDFRVESSANLVQIKNNAVNQGGIIVERISREVNKSNYTYVGAPVATNLSIATSNLKKVELYSEATPNNFVLDTLTSANFRWGRNVNQAGNQAGWQYQTDLMNPAEGYIIKAPNFPGISTDFSVKKRLKFRYDGKPNNGIYTQSIIANESLGVKPKMSLVSNPYPSAIDIDKFLLDNSGEDSPIIPVIYLWNNNNSPILGQNGIYNFSSGGYTVYNLVGAVNPIPIENPNPNNTVFNGELASGQGFFVIGSELGGDLLFDNSYRYKLTSQGGNQTLPTIDAHDNNIFLRQNQNTPEFEKHRFWLNIQNNNNEYKESLIGFTNYSSDNLDNLDGPLLSGSGLELFTFIDDLKYAIQSFELPFDVNKEIPLGFKTINAGTYTISLHNFDGLFVNQDIYLEDLLLNQTVNLKDVDYEFVSQSGEFPNRFIITFFDTLSNLPTQEFAKDWIAYSKDKIITIESLNFEMKEIIIYDMLGRQLYASTDLDNTNKHMISNLFSDGVLIVNVVDKENNIYSKKILK